MNELAPIIFNEVKEAQKELSSLGAHVVNMSFPTEYPWEVFTSSCSWTVPDDGEYFILCLGGGGGGGGIGSGGVSGSASYSFGAVVALAVETLGQLVRTTTYNYQAGILTGFTTTEGGV